jgi:N-methylhydantoinase A
MFDTSATLRSARASASTTTPGQRGDVLGYTVDIDTGGTFTDGYVVGPGGSVRVKSDTTPHNFAVGVLECIKSAAAGLGTTPADLMFETDIVRISTTVCTNAVINRRGARVGVLMGADLHERHAGRLSSELPLEPSLVEVVPDQPSELDADRVDQAVRRLLERGARVIVIALGGARLDARESAMRDLIARSFPRHYLGAVPVLRSSLVTLATDPVVRVHTAVLNAYVHSVMSRFLYQLEDELKELGYRNPLLSANADNGTSRVAKTTAISTWGSGPAAGAAAAQTLARELGFAHVVALDIGGTSSDITVLEGLTLRRTVRPHIEGVEVSLPTVDVFSVGIGGGSVARVVDGAVVVGPDSMGGVPGPASFGLGGDRATLTDALCGLGVFDAANFSGGRKRLDVARARDVISAQLADPLGVDMAAAAELVVDSAVEEINRHVMRLVGETDVAMEDFTLVAFGGNGGVLAHRVAERLGIERACTFPLSAVFSAFGMSGLDLVHAYEAMPDEEEFDRTVRQLKDRAERDMRGEGVEVAGLSFHLEAEITDRAGSVSVVDVADNGITEGPTTEPALLRMRAVLPGRGATTPSANGPGSVGTGKREVLWASGRAAADLFDWDAVAAGDVINGPALLENELTTVLIPPGSHVTIGAFAEAMFGFSAAALKAPAEAVEGRAT